MEIIPYIFMIFYVYQSCIKVSEAGPTYVLLRGTRSDVERECIIFHGGSIIIFRSTPPDELIDVLRNDNSVSVWNGYKYTSPLVENTGCFEKTGSHRGFNVTSPDLTIAYCEHFCNRHEITHFAIQESHCFCLEPEGIDSNFESRPIADCNYTCNMKPDECCGSNRNSTIYNIYSVVDSYIFTDLYTPGDGLCLLYKLWQNKIYASVCDDDVSNRIACRSIDNAVEWIYKRGDQYTWDDSLHRCLNLRKSKLYLASFLDVLDEAWGKVWLNERKYRTFVENKNGDESLKRCQTISIENGKIVINESKCDALEGVQYVCKTGNDKAIKTSTNTIISATEDSATVVQIGGAVGGVILIAVVGGIALALVLKRRHAGSCNKESQDVRYSIANGVTNSAYGSVSAYDRIQGNQDRNSQGDYTNINDEDLRISGNTHSKANMCDDPRGLSPSNGPLYMVLEKATTSESPSFSSFTNYESARPIPDQKSNEKNVSETDELKRNADDMEYDHLRQEAYEHKVTDENVYNHADNDNEYSHISQITKTNDNHKDDDDDDDDYTHTGDFEAHSGTSVQNDMDDTYAHANDNYDNGDDMAEIRSYELAQNVHRHETDTD